MASLNIEKLLAPVAEASTCGKDLQDESAYREIDRLAMGTPERVSGTSVIAAVDPDWKAVQQRCVELLEQTRDLRVLTWLALSLLRLEGFDSLRQGLDLLKQTVERFWDCVYPQLDADDDNDPTARLNALYPLVSREANRGPALAVTLVRQAPLTASRLGRFSLTDIAIAEGRWTPDNPEAPKLEIATIVAAAKETPVEVLQTAAEGVRQSARLAKELEAAIDARVPMGRGVNLDDFIQALNEAGERLARFLSLRGVVPSPGPNDDNNTHPEPAAGDDGRTPRNSRGAGPAISGEVQSTADVVRLIEKICDFYKRTEPSSPVPIILKRAQRLVGKDFWEILNDLSPSAIETVRVISGTEATEETPPAS